MQQLRFLSLVINVLKHVAKSAKTILFLTFLDPLPLLAAHDCCKEKVYTILYIWCYKTLRVKSC